MAQMSWEGSKWVLLTKPCIKGDGIGIASLASCTLAPWAVLGSLGMVTLPRIMPALISSVASLFPPNTKLQLFPCFALLTGRWPGLGYLPPCPCRTTVLVLISCTGPLQRPLQPAHFSYHSMEHRVHFPFVVITRVVRADGQTCIGLQIALDSQAQRCFINIPYYFSALLITALGNNGSTQQLWSSDTNQPSLRGAMGHSQKSIYLGKHSIYTQAQGMREALEEARPWCLLLGNALPGSMDAPHHPGPSPHTTWGCGGAQPVHRPPLIPL